MQYLEFSEEMYSIVAISDEVFVPLLKQAPLHKYSQNLLSFLVGSAVHPSNTI